MEDRKTVRALTLAEVEPRLSYNPETGSFVWKDATKYHKDLINKEAGCIQQNKGKRYRKIKINGRHYSAHRLAWLFVYGELPDLMIDHINGDSLDNRIDNLRLADSYVNAQNHICKIKENGLPTGVRKTNRRYSARITVEDKQITIGTFDTIKQAATAYKKKREEMHYGAAF